jgi:hypothetical protein
MAKAEKHSTPAEFDLPYWPNWMTFNDALAHVASIVGDLGRATELLRRGLMDGTIEFQNEAKSIRWTREDFRGVTVDELGRMLIDDRSNGHVLDLTAEMRERPLDLLPLVRRRDIYRRWPPHDWPMGAAERQPEEVAAEEETRATQAGKGAEEKPQSLETAEEERWPVPLATKPEKFRGKSFGDAPFRAARELYKMGREGVPWVHRPDRLLELNKRLDPYPVKERTMDTAVDYLKDHRLIIR